MTSPHPATGGDAEPITPVRTPPTPKEEPQEEESPPPLLAGRFGPPPLQTPRQTFAHHSMFRRFWRVNREEPELLVYAAGVCNSAGSDSSRAACGWLFNAHVARFCFRLENSGPTGNIYPQTKERAELRAAIHALTIRQWAGEGWRNVVIATDSKHVVNGVTGQISTRLQWDWQDPSRGMDEDWDLWAFLLDVIRRLFLDGVRVSFWLIPRGWNAQARELAQMATEAPDVEAFVVQKYLR
ncbi:hypothetical protein PABG_12668 [Paracoccidioides brasiliensis Pb03]|nr:hypothetical protein PABG_12668 [Paracoccidioides brasiliensis Pb03]